jgi:prophage antirepressor-like protein
MFSFNKAAVRTLLIDGNPWFVATDLAEILGYQSAKDMLRLLDEDERGGGHFLPTLGGVQEHSIINESGLYGVILRSNKPEAKAFRKWVTGEVLPAIRKQGFYKSPEYARITELEREQKSAQHRIEDLDDKAAMLRAELRQAEEKLADYKDAPKLVKLRIDASKDKERNRAEREMTAFMRRRSALISRQVKIINSALKGLNLRGDYVLGNAVDEIESLISAWVLSDPIADPIESEGGAE